MVLFLKTCDVYIFTSIEMLISGQPKKGILLRKIITKYWEIEIEYRKVLWTRKNVKNIMKLILRLFGMMENTAFIGNLFWSSETP